ncbi:MAG: glycoside hydrolase family 3 C-terminal domain-containing protein [Fibrobacterales bacterium]
MKHLLWIVTIGSIFGCSGEIVNDDLNNSSDSNESSEIDTTSSSENSESVAEFDESSELSSSESLDQESQSSSHENKMSSQKSSMEELGSIESSIESSSESSSSEQSSSEYVQELICEWGTEKLNICEFDSREEVIDAFLNAMTTDEKIAQMTQTRWFDMSPTEVADWGLGSIIHTQGDYVGPDAIQWVHKMKEFQEASLKTRLGIPLLIAVDAVHGQNTFEGATIFPHNINMAATRNMDLIEEAAKITAKEIAGTGFNWTFSPCIAMPQNENWGRVYEGYTEDTDLTTDAVIASIKGHQQGALAAPWTVGTTAKHFIGDGATNGGDEGGNAEMSMDELRAKYLPPYAAAVEQGVTAIMVGFNSVNGTNMHQNGDIVNGILREELNFEGVVVTDWEGGTRYGHASIVINSGVDIAMQPKGLHVDFINQIKGSVNDGGVSMDRINDAVRHIIGMKYDLGLFSDPFPQEEYAESVGSPEHREVARQAVRESLVLLKSENGALPLTSDDDIIIVGEHGDNSGLQSGGWSIEWQGVSRNYSGATTMKDAIQKIAPSALYSANGCSGDMSGKKAVVVVGETPYAEFMGDTDESDYRLWMTDSHKGYINSCVEAGAQVITILVSGRVLAVEGEIVKSDAYIAAFFIGSEGDGVADFLFGIDGFIPKGKSPYSWPKDPEDIPLAMNDSKALYPFGYGLEDY